MSEQVFINCTNAGPLSVYVRDGKWIPIRMGSGTAMAMAIAHVWITEDSYDRGAVLCIAVITERLRPGIVHSYASSAKYDPLEPGKPDSIDKGGCINLLTSSRMLSKNAPGMTPNSCLIDIEKWEG